MTTRMLGAPIARKEDPRFLTGNGNYIDDIELPGMLHAAILRSPHAHARILTIDSSAALVIEGVEAILTYADLGSLGERLPLLIPHPALTQPRTQYALAKDEVNYVGEAVAMVVARDRYVAEDALALIDVDYEPLPAISPADLTAAATSESELVHTDVPENIAARLVQEVGDCAAAFASAAHVFERRVQLERSTSQPIETRGVVARFDA